MRIGIDLGGTKIEGIAIRGSDEAARMRVETPRGDYAGDHRSGGRHSRSARAARWLERVRGRRHPGNDFLRHRPGQERQLRLADRQAAPERISSSASAREVRIANDANCFAVSEAADGAATGAATVFGVIVGTGTGAGIVVNGQVLTGPNGIAGEWGHNPLPWPADDERPGPACYCGRRGCIETFLSGPGLQADYERHSGRSLTPAAIVQDAAGGDQAARDALGRYAGRMARALASIINVLDPDVIVLGGGMSNMSQLYVEVPRLWGPFVFSDTVATRLVRARHGDASGVRGAAWLWPNEVAVAR